MHCILAPHQFSFLLLRTSLPRKSPSLGPFITSPLYCQSWCILQLEELSISFNLKTCGQKVFGFDGNEISFLILYRGIIIAK